MTYETELDKYWDRWCRNCEHRGTLHWFCTIVDDPEAIARGASAVMINEERIEHCVDRNEYELRTKQEWNVHLVGDIP